MTMYESKPIVIRQTIYRILHSKIAFYMRWNLQSALVLRQLHFSACDGRDLPLTFNRRYNSHRN